MKKIISFLFAIILLASITSVAFAADQPFMTANVSYSQNQDKTADSYLNVFLSNITKWNSFGVTNGEYPGWCFDYEMTISPGVIYQAGIYNPYDTDNQWYSTIPNAPSRWSVIPWDKITYLINVFRDRAIESVVDFDANYTQAYLDTNGPARWNHIQWVIWYYTNYDNEGLRNTVLANPRRAAIINWLDNYMPSGYDPTTDSIQLLVALGDYSSADRNVQLSVFEVPNTPLSYRDETAWAFGDNENWDLKGLNSNNWGWNSPLTESKDEYVFPIYAGAGQNDISKGTLVGNVYVLYTDGKVKVTYDIFNGIELLETHLWVGNTQLPIQKNGKYTTAPGKMNKDVGVWIPVEGDVYVAFHAVVSIPDGWWH